MCDLDFTKIFDETVSELESMTPEQREKFDTDLKEKFDTIETEQSEKYQREYVDTKCPRCLGRGHLTDYWYNQRGLCFKCGGSGKA